MTTGPRNPGQVEFSQDGVGPACENYGSLRDENGEVPLGTAIGVVSLAVLIAGGALYNANRNGDSDGEHRTPSADEIADMNEVCEQVAGTWAMPGLDHGDNHRWEYGGSQEIRDAISDEEAANAANSVLGRYTLDPQIMAGAARSLLDRVVDPMNLIDENGCATEEAEILLAEMSLELELAKSITADYAPENWYNSGVDENGNVVWSNTPGVGGDRESRKAIKIVLANGKAVYVLGRCIQIVEKEPNGPEGPTDNKTTTTTSINPVITTTTARPNNTTSTTGPNNTTTTIEEKNDDNKKPGTGEDSEQSPGTPDVPGQGPAGQTPNPDTGYLPGETPPATQATRPTSPETTKPNPTTTVRPPATTSPASVNTSLPVSGTSPSTSILPGPRPIAP